VKLRALFADVDQWKSWLDALCRRQYPDGTMGVNKEQRSR
jgi:hypothetical protein